MYSKSMKTKRMIITRCREVITFWDFKVYKETLPRRTKGDIQHVDNI